VRHSGREGARVGSSPGPRRILRQEQWDRGPLVPRQGSLHVVASLTLLAASALPPGFTRGWHLVLHVHRSRRTALTPRTSYGSTACASGSSAAAAAATACAVVGLARVAHAAAAWVLLLRINQDRTSMVRASEGTAAFNDGGNEMVAVAQGSVPECERVRVDE
jgi:hypothetical protein